GCVPIGCPRASRHCAWWNRSLRRNAVIAGRRGTWSSASQQCAASSSSWETVAVTSTSYGCDFDSPISLIFWQEPSIQLSKAERPVRCCTKSLAQGLAASSPRLVKRRNREVQLVERISSNRHGRDGGDPHLHAHAQGAPLEKRPDGQDDRDAHRSMPARASVPEARADRSKSHSFEAVAHVSGDAGPRDRPGRVRLPEPAF